MKKILILLALGGALVFYMAYKKSSVTDDMPIMPTPMPEPSPLPAKKKKKSQTTTLTAKQKLAESNKKLVETIVKALRTNVVTYKRKRRNDNSAESRASWILSSLIRNKSRLNQVKAMYLNTYQSDLMDDLRRPLSMTVYNKYKNLK